MGLIKKTKHNLASNFWLTLSLSIAAFLGFIYIVIGSLENPKEAIWGSNIKFYVIALLLFVGALFVFRLLSLFFPGCVFGKLSQLQLPKPAQIALAVLLGAGAAFLSINRLFETEPLEFAVDTTKLICNFPVVFLVFLALLFIPLSAVILYRSRKNFDVSKPITYSCYFIVVLCSFFSVYFPNLVMSDIHHGVAYVETVFNVLHGVPFDAYTTGIYGHYGLFYAPFLWLLGGKGSTLVLLISCVAAIATCAAIYTLHHVLPKNWMRIVAAFSLIVSVAVLRERNYWQVQPHRVLFPLLIVAYITYLSRSPKIAWWKVLLGYGICCLGILWNTESGAFCCLALSYSLIIKLFQERKWYALKNWLQIAYYLFLSVAALAGALAIVNVYNLLHGGKIIFKAFFFRFLKKPMYPTF